MVWLVIMDVAVFQFSLAIHGIAWNYPGRVAKLAARPGAKGSGETENRAETRQKPGISGKRESENIYGRGIPDSFMNPSSIR